MFFHPPLFFHTHTAEEAEFDALEAEVDMELEAMPAPLPSCADPKLLAFGVSACTKPADLSRGNGYKPSNEAACVADSKGLGCELVKEKEAFFPKCAAGFHVVVKTPSLCSINCPAGWADEPTQCIKPAAAATSAAAAIPPRAAK